MKERAFLLDQRTIKLMTISAVDVVKTNNFNNSLTGKRRIYFAI